MDLPISTQLKPFSSSSDPGRSRDSSPRVKQVTSNSTADRNIGIDFSLTESDQDFYSKYPWWSLERQSSEPSIWARIGIQMSRYCTYLPTYLLYQISIVRVGTEVTLERRIRMVMHDHNLNFSHEVVAWLTRLDFAWTQVDSPSFDCVCTVLYHILGTYWTQDICLEYDSLFRANHQARHT